MSSTRQDGNEMLDSRSGRPEPTQASGDLLGDLLSEPAPTAGPAQRARVSKRGTVITLSTVLTLAAAVFLTILTVAPPDSAIADYDALAWVWSSGRGEADRINAVTARVDTRARIEDSANHPIDITQTDQYLILRDLSTGQVSALDLTTLQVSAVMPTTPGYGVRVALDGDSAFVIDTVRGQVRQLDARSLAPVGDSITLPPNIVAGGFDGQGILWVAVPSEGTVVAIKPGTGGAGPYVHFTTTVADPNHDLALSTLDDGVAVLDNTTARLHQLRGSTGRRAEKATAVPLSALGEMPARTVGPVVVITVPAERRVIVVDGDRVRSHKVPGTGGLSPAVAYAGYVYVPDPVAGKVYALSAEGTLMNTIRISAAGGDLDLQVREGHLFINAPDGATAQVVDGKHTARPVEKYAAGVMGADPPPPVETPPPPATVPGAPKNVTAVAGDACATIGWGRAPSGGAQITKYVIQGAGQTITVGAGTRSVQVQGLTNGHTYTFTVHAVNRHGAGPKAKAPAVTPTADVPFPPASISAQARPDGTVELSWPAADGGGRRITAYTVTAIGGDAEAPLGSVSKTSMIVPAGSLAYGTQYAFSVAAINDRDATSDPSPLSDTVVPFTVPGAPENLTAYADPQAPGAILVAWNPADENGRTITAYVAEDAAGNRQTVNATTARLDGYGNDEAVLVSVYAVNEAGDGPRATATARTMGEPSLTFTSDSAGYNDITVTFTPNNRGGAAVCRVEVEGNAGSAETACETAPVTLTVTGLWPNRTYRYTISVTTPAGSASEPRSRATNQLRFTVLCDQSSYCGSGVWAYSVPSQASTSNAVAALAPGTTHTPQCRVSDDDVNAKPWGGKRSKIWLGFQYDGKQAYFPWAWATLDGGDDPNRLPPC